MLVFIDESGDPGFKLEKGSTPIFVVSMVIFDNADAALETQERVEGLRGELGVRPEFKFNKSSDTVRDRFFRGIRGCPFATRALVVDKKLIHSPNLRSVKDSFYKFFIRMVAQHDGGVLEDAKVVIDGSGDRAFKQQFRTYLRRNVDAGCVRKWELKDSLRDPLIQLADMAAGCIARSYRLDRPKRDRWRRMLDENGQLQNVWEFE